MKKYRVYRREESLNSIHWQASDDVDHVVAYASDIDELFGLLSSNFRKVVKMTDVGQKTCYCPWNKNMDLVHIDTLEESVNNVDEPKIESYSVNKN